MKILQVVALVCCMCIAARAQKVDSLETAIRQTKADSTKTILLSLLADELTKSDPPTSLAKAREGLSLSRKIGFDKGMFENYYSLASSFRGQALFDSAVFYFHLAHSVALRRNDVGGQAEICSSFGHCFMRKSEMDSARYYLDKGLVLAKNISDFRVEAGIYNNYGNVFLEESNYQKALEYFVMSAKLYENPLADDYGQCVALSNIGNIEYRLGNHIQALDYAQQSMTIARKRSFTSSIGYAHKLLGRIYRAQKKYDAALAEYEQAQALYLTLGDARSAGEVEQNIGNIYFDKENHRDALAHYLKSLRLAKSVPTKTIIAGGYSCIGQAYLLLGENDKALRYLDSAIVATQETGNKYLMMDNYQAISAAHEAKGDFKTALKAHHQFVTLKDSITASENRAIAEETQARYELEKKEARISLLEKDKELKTLAMERQRAIQVGIGIALLLVIIIAMLLVNRYRVSSRAKRLAEIEGMRDAIARDLHDDIGSTLSTINIISKLAMRESSNGNLTYLNRIAEQSSIMMENMADMVWSINPVNDSLARVVVKMKVFTGEILEPRNISYRFSGEESLNGMMLDADRRKNLFLIFKEAINNIAKYSEATEVEITLMEKDRQVLLKVSDNGVGFDEKYVMATKVGNGLSNMAAMARTLRAEFNLSSVVGRGTSVELVVPIT